ncbi:MAG: discoidin domain-containing protein, partial [Muribaculum sp.]|nr:discoidin domain-containing protein [Muribaculum sp.]
EINSVVAGEDISKGQRVENFMIEVLNSGKWRMVADGTTIGHNRIVMFNPMTVDAVRLTVTSSRGEPNLKPLKAYRVEMPAEERADTANVPDGYRAVDGVTASLQGDAIQVTLPETTKISGFIYTPHADVRPGTIYRYKCETSPDWGTWSAPAGVTGEFGNIMHNPTPRTVIFSTPVDARVMKLYLKEDARGASGVSPSWSDITLLARQ